MLCSIQIIHMVGNPWRRGTSWANCEAYLSTFKFHVWGEDISMIHSYPRFLARGFNKDFCFSFTSLTIMVPPHIQPSWNYWSVNDVGYSANKSVSCTWLPRSDPVSYFLACSQYLWRKRHCCSCLSVSLAPSPSPPLPHSYLYRFHHSPWLQTLNSSCHHVHAPLDRCGSLKLASFQLSVPKLSRKA